MKHFVSINHVGYAVRDIQKTAQYYIEAGWRLSNLYEEVAQQTRIAFLKKDGFIPIELVSPLEEGRPSPVDTLLRKIGCCTYHVCYNVDDIDLAFEDLFNEGFRPLFDPIESLAMNGHKICYLYNLQVGLIEIVSN